MEHARDRWLAVGLVLQHCKLPSRPAVDQQVELPAAVGQSDVVWPSVVEVLEDRDAQRARINVAHHILAIMGIDCGSSCWGVLDWLERVHDEQVVVFRPCNVADPCRIRNVREHLDQLAVFGELNDLVGLPVGNVDVVVVAKMPCAV